MQTQVSQWGNSLAVRLPQALVRELRLAPGTKLDLKLTRQDIVLRKARPRYDLASMLKQITKESLHGEDDWGPAVGREVW